jgi:hypothetical protein
MRVAFTCGASGSLSLDRAVRLSGVEVSWSTGLLTGLDAGESGTQTTVKPSLAWQKSRNLDSHSYVAV